MGKDAPDTSGYEAAAAARRMPLEVVTLSEPDVLDLYQNRLILVRPDGHVAWRADAMPSVPDAVLATARGARAMPRN